MIEQIAVQQPDDSFDVPIGISDSPADMNSLRFRRPKDEPATQTADRAATTPGRSAASCWLLRR